MSAERIISKLDRLSNKPKKIVSETLAELEEARESSEDSSGEETPVQGTEQLLGKRGAEESEGGSGEEEEDDEEIQAMKMMGLPSKFK